MKIFLTGATGSIGRAIALRLTAAGHRVIALARSDASAHAVRALGAEAARGELSDAVCLRSLAEEADAVIHAAYSWDAQAQVLETNAVAAFCAAGRPLVVTSGAGVLGDTGAEPADEDRVPDPASPLAWRVAIERRVMEADGVVIRPSLAYDARGHRIVRALQEHSARAGAGLYVGDGTSRWSTVHVDDLADLYLRALEQRPTARLFHAGAATITMRELAEAIGKGVTRPWLVNEAIRVLPAAAALARNMVVSSERARELLGWAPQQPPLTSFLI